MTHALYAGLMIWIQLILTQMNGRWTSTISQVFSRCGLEHFLNHCLLLISTRVLSMLTVSLPSLLHRLALFWSYHTQKLTTIIWGTFAYMNESMICRTQIMLRWNILWAIFTGGSRFVSIPLGEGLTVLLRIAQCHAENSMSIQKLAIVCDPTLFGNSGSTSSYVSATIADAPYQNKVSGIFFLV